ncbi:ww domain containing protein [Stylonychia lemnae]|uniref:Ww domain containing protein n=1 Tax=Stylonychia lemnae TaxID=5949 RepID=A0A078A7N7_STYLE|nr:ww domain containing protein [Stylonychia lemnae]|eukprot:CDW77582.1 ww domain containing protein [Stylonychia lemnae]
MMIGNNQNFQNLDIEDEEYQEPTDEGKFILFKVLNQTLEILSYAQELGMNIHEDRDLLWICEEGVRLNSYLNISQLTAPLPNPWRMIQDKQGAVQYFNTETGQIQNEHPLDEHYRQLYLREKAKKLQLLNQEQNRGQNWGGSSGIGAHLNQPLAANNNNSFLTSQNNAHDAQVQRILQEQIKILDQDYKESIEHIDKNFELKKQEILKQNEKEIEAEKQKWDLYKKEEERKIKLEQDMHIDAQITLFKEKLHQEEERERLQIQKDSETQLRQYEKEQEEKYIREKQTLEESYARIRKTLEETEKERYEFELEKFRKDQGRTLDSKKTDIEKLKNEKRKIQGEYNQQVESLRREMEKNFDKEKRDQEELLRQDIEQIEKEEQQKYERKVEQMKRDMQTNGLGGNSHELEIQQYKEELEEEYELAIREYKKQLEDQLQQEEEKWEKKRQRELKDYEQILIDQHEQDLKRKQQKLQLSKENEERELELIKLRIDQMYQDQVESYRKQQMMKYEKERRLFEDEKRKRMQDIQSSIDKLNIASSDKEKLRHEIDNLNREQKDLQKKIQSYEEDLDNEKSKKRQLERDINELNIQLNSKKAIGDDSQRVQYIKDEISKKQVEIQQAQRQYKDLIESKFDNFSSISPPKNEVKDNANIQKLEQEMKQIKELLMQHNSTKANDGVRKQTRFQDMLEEVHNYDKENSDDNADYDRDTTHMKEYIHKERAVLKDLKRKIDQDKADLRRDKKSAEDYKYSDPSAYRQRIQLLDRVQQNIERKIDEFNDRFAKLQDAEKLSKQ